MKVSSWFHAGSLAISGYMNRRFFISSGSAFFHAHLSNLMLNNLIADQEQICTPETPKADTMQINNLSRALKQELERQPVNEDAAKNLALELASARYTGIGDQEYETVRLRRLFGEYTTPMQELDAALLRSAVSAVRMRRCSISILLKNGQIVERSRAL